MRWHRRGDWGGIYLEQNANLTLTYAHICLTRVMGLALTRRSRIVEITHSRLEFSGGGINLNGYERTQYV